MLDVRSSGPVPDGRYHPPPAGSPSTLKPFARRGSSRHAGSFYRHKLRDWAWLSNKARAELALWAETWHLSIRREDPSQSRAAFLTLDRVARFDNARAGPRSRLINREARRRRSPSPRSRAISECRLSPACSRGLAAPRRPYRVLRDHTTFSPTVAKNSLRRGFAQCKQDCARMAGRDVRVAAGLGEAGGSGPSPDFMPMGRF